MECLRWIMSNALVSLNFTLRAGKCLEIYGFVPTLHTFCRQASAQQVWSNLLGIKMIEPTSCIVIINLEMSETMTFPWEVVKVSRACLQQILEYGAVLYISSKWEKEQRIDSLHVLLFHEILFLFQDPKCIFSQFTCIGHFCTKYPKYDRFSLLLRRYTVLDIGREGMKTIMAGTTNQVYFKN